LFAENFDIYKVAGAGYTAYITSKAGVTVNDGSLTINLAGVMQNAKILAIEILPVTGSSSTLAPAACVDHVVDFDRAADRAYLDGGAYISNQYEEWGLLLSTSGGFGNKPHLFNTSYDGNDLFGGPDLGTLNEQCTPPGPG
jgi:hypothetical protein